MAAPMERGLLKMSVSVSGERNALKCFFFVFLIVSHNVEHVYTIEPITSGIAVGTAIAASAFLAGFDKMKCAFVECCDENWITPNISGLAVALKQRLHGQHLVLDSVVKALRGHINNPSPSKALALSFHGWTGGGKNFVSRIIAEHLYRQGMESIFVNVFVSTLHFSHESRIETYKDQLRDWIKGNTSACARSMFVFDEMDKMPPGLIDQLKPYLDHYPEINGVDYRKTIFIFLSNTAGNGITKQTLSHWEAGKKRDDIELKEMEEIITVGAFNEEGGYWHSSLIDKNLITIFIPFLPLERQHVKMCIRDDLIAKGFPISEEIISKVADELQYFPKDHKLFSKSGCKRVSQKVDLIIEEL